MTSETLAPDIAWEPSGHLSEVALSALADGEEALLDAAMLGHVDACEACAGQLGEIAMRGAHVGEALSLLGAAASAEAPVGVDAIGSAPVSVGVAASTGVAASVPAPVSAGARGAAPVVVPAPAPVDSEARGRSIFVASAPEPGSATQASWATSRSATRRDGARPRAGHAAEEGPPPARRKVPVAVVGAALAVAVIGAAPALASLPRDVAETASVLQKVLPSLVRMLPVAIGKLWNGPTTGAAAALVWSLSLALIAAGFGIAKRASKRTLMNGGRR